MLDSDVRKIARLLSGQTKTIDLRVPSLADDSWVDSDLVQRIPNMTAAERKRLGISKTTHWYARRNLRIGKPIRA